MTLGFDYYDSVYKFVDTICSAPLNNSFKANRKEHSHTNGERFTGTSSFSEAQRLLSEGYAEGCKAILEGSDKVLRNSGGCRVETKVDYVGSHPHIPNTVMGLPKTMIRSRRIPVPKKTLKLVYECGASQSVTKETLFKGGANLYAFIKFMESRGVRTEVYVTMGTYCLDNAALLCVKIKDFRQSINPMLVSYPLTHTSFMRRHGFRWIETSSHTDYCGFVKNYGHPLKSLTENSTEYAISNNSDAALILKGAQHLDCEKMARCRSIQQIMEMIKL